MSAPSPRAVLALLTGLMLVDFADRQVLVAAFPYLRAEWGLADTTLGALVSVVTLTVALGALPAASLVDRWSRTRAIALMGTVWSAAAAASAFAPGPGTLLAARIGVGAGEAGYGPAGGALLATLFPAQRRAAVLGVFQAAGPLGTVVGMLLGSAVAAQWGWRWAVAVMVVPGLLLALAVLRVRDYPTVRTVPRGPRAVAGVLRTRTVVAAVTGMVLLLVVASSLYTWLPTHFERDLHLAPAQAGGLAAVVMLAGVAGTAGAGLLTDRAARRDPGARLRTPVLAGLATTALLVPAFTLVPAGPGQVALVLLGAAAVTAAVGPAAAVVVDVTHPGVRATAFSVLVVAQNLLGLTVGPVLTGALADTIGLTTAFALLAALGVVAAGAFLVAARAYPGDRAAVLGPDAVPADLRPTGGG
ncbi:putative MFS family arabinose efflux permease [Actinomycetospora succinea]|uniref:Putative MFS family arabinose efflux permease n=1 Tax=Actinomycetospora succinea TaxID=663603 RepID=A0A4R6V5V9_9PSEU|nr:MFS transporter [Actinomycetospora succinea]TDQ55885.1 putative MFS family arabinose efflux permease [Actinomycetospora succinea]